jgi:hypothetical protein
MSEFICPQCGQSSEYDPWAEQASCQHCGFSPPDGQEMLDYLHQQEPAAAEQEQPAEEPVERAEPAQLTRFLPTDGRSFVAGLAWGVLVFAVIMLVGSTFELPGDAVRCLGLSLPFLTTFAVWRWMAWRETGA